jgi:hypothetical protein
MPRKIDLGCLMDCICKMDFVNAITTLLHLAALQTSPGLFYSAIVSLSTLASFVWHLSGGEFSGWLMKLDYGLVVAWFLTDMVLSLRASSFQNVLFWNCMILLLHKVMMGWMHAVWHVLSALKCILVTKMLTGDV